MSQPKPANDNNTTRIAILETNVIYIHEALEKIDRRFDQVDKRFEQVDRRFDAILAELRDNRKESWSQFRWIMGAVFFGIFIPIVLKGFHWL